jgi:hypothetical protein
LVAITLLSIAALGAAGTLALTVRVLHEADWRTTHARLVEAVGEALHARLSATGGSCTALTQDSVSGPGGANVRWTAAPTGIGAEVTLVFRRRPLISAADDTLRLSLPCR